MQPPPRSDFSKVAVAGRLRRWRTNDTARTVLVVVRTTTGLMRLLDVLPLVASDHRVQTVFTYDDERAAVFGAGLPALLESWELPVIPWRVARRKRFDLALAASENDDLRRLRAPVVLLPHGLGHQKYYPGTDTVAGMNPRRLLRRGRSVPVAVALAHPSDRDMLRDRCGPVADRGHVVGDPCLDRLLASTHRARGYREALRAGDRTVVFVASTWGRDSLFGNDPRLPERLLAELPADEYRVVMSLHTGVWAHGPWQLRAWLARARRSGLWLVPEHEGWRAALAAADVVVSDLGSLSVYAAATETPMLLAAGEENTTVAGSAAARLASLTPRLDLASPLRAQVEHARTSYEPERLRNLVDTAVDGRGKAMTRLRALLYELLTLSEPDEPSEPEPLPVPETEPSYPAALLVGGAATGDGVAVARFPSAGTAAGWDHRHRAADPDRARLSEVDAATILYLPDGPDLAERAESAFATWPSARLVAAVTGERTCTVLRRDDEPLRLRLSDPVDPLLAASLVHVRLTTWGRLPSRDVLHLGHRRVTVSVETL